MQRVRATTRRSSVPFRLLALAATLVLFIAGCSSQDDGAASSLDVRPIHPTAAEGAPSAISPLFWDAMSGAGVTAGMHDGYQACLHPELGVVVFDIDRFGTLVNPAFDAGYVSGSRAIAASCTALIGDLSASTDGSAAAKERHRVATVGANFDTLDSHPDFGKGFDVAENAVADLDCSVASLRAAAPPKSWRLDYPSEFQSGYAAALAGAERTCAELNNLAYTDDAIGGP